MQAEGWKAEWSIAMQENERLRMALFDAESALEQLPPKEEGEEGNEANEGADDEMQWRELCTSIARAADEEKATLLEELNMVRAELEHKRSTAFSTHDDQQRAEVEANKARANADNWRAQYERELEELERLAAQLKEMQSRSTEAQKTARGNEQSSTGVLAAWREANKKRNEAEAKLHTKKRRAEKKLTTVFVVYASVYYRFIIARAPADGYTCFREGVSRAVVALPVSRTEASAPHYRWSLHSAKAS
jgi:hypothetical protein